MHIVELGDSRRAGGSHNDSGLPSRRMKTVDSSTSAAASRWSENGSLNLHSEQDWDSAKPKIIQLYLDQKLSLDEVMDIMELQHNFKASLNMYKKRLARWKVRKYRRHRHNVPSHRTISTIATLPTRDPERRGDRPRKTLLATTLQQPPDLEKMHQILDNIKLYATNVMPTSARTGRRPPDHQACTNASGILFDDFSIIMSHAVLSFLAADAATAGAQLRNAFLSLETLLSAAIELALPKIFYAVLTFAASGFPDLTRILFIHATRLASVSSGARHPAVLVLRRLSELAAAAPSPFVSHVVLATWRACHGSMTDDRTVRLFLVRRRFWIDAAPEKVRPPSLVGADPKEEEEEPGRAIDRLIATYSRLPYGTNFEACSPGTIARVLRNAGPEGAEAAEDLLDWMSSMHYELAWFHARYGDRERTLEHMQAAGMTEERALWQLEQLDGLRSLEKRDAILKAEVLRKELTGGAPSTNFPP